MLVLSCVGVVLSLRKLYKPCKEFYSKYRDFGKINMFGKELKPKNLLIVAFFPITKILYPVVFLIMIVFEAGEECDVDGRLLLLNCLALGLLFMLAPLIQGGTIDGFLRKPIVLILTCRYIVPAATFFRYQPKTAVYDCVIR